MPSRFSRFKVPKKIAPAQTASTIELLQAERAQRREGASGGALGGLAAGVVAGLGGAQFSETRQKVLLALGSATAGAGIGAVRGLWKSRPLVRQATIEVGRALCVDWKKNRFIEELVSHYPYIIVDARGNLVGASTNPNRLGFGRLRLVTEKIRSGAYLEEKGPAPKIFENRYLDKHGAQSLVRLLIGARNANDGQKVREISEKLAGQLAADALHDKALEHFFAGTRYFFVDKKGDLVASRTAIVNKMGLGHQRFASKDVLEELGSLRWWGKSFPGRPPPQ